MLSAPLLRALLNAAVAALGLGALLMILLGMRALRSAAGIQYFRLRRNRLTGAWFGLTLAIFIAAAAYVLFTLVDPITFHYYPPTPSQTPSLTPTTSPTVTPTIYVTATTTPTPTPYLPPVVGILFKSSVTPAPQAAFSEIMFTQTIDERIRPLTPGKTFSNPIHGMYAVFHYENLNKGAQYTALWWRDGELVFYETKPWDGPPEGFAYSLWKPADLLAWKAGVYEVQIFLGADWKSVGSFTVQGNPFTSTPTHTVSPTGSLSPTPSRTPSITVTPSPSRTPTHTPTATTTRTPTSSLTPRPSPTTTPTLTPTRTFTPSITPSPTRTATITPSSSPSWTPSITPSPTSTRTPTATFTATKTWTPSITPWPTNTRTRVPSLTPSVTISPWPSSTSTRTPSKTATPTATATPQPSRTMPPSATPSLIPHPSATPRPTNTSRPTLPPWPTATKIAINPEISTPTEGRRPNRHAA